MLLSRQFKHIEGKDVKQEREIWVDDVKVIACILVVLGHFFQSMTKAGILPANDLYQWFDQTIYYFHVPLFFICSGYLYQKISSVDSLQSYGKNIIKKAVQLGVPYVTFSVATWLLKSVFSGSVNTEARGLMETLLFHPAAPYWYLYALFFIFLVTPTFKDTPMAVCGLAIAVVCKGLSAHGLDTNIYAVSTVMQNEIWLIIGMSLCLLPMKPCKKWIGTGIFTGTAFLIISVVVYKNKVNTPLLPFLLGVIASLAVIAIVAGVDGNGTQSKTFAYLSKYTMPIFLMHTLFAAAFRSVLLKCGIRNAAIHLIVGIAVSFVGPIIAADIMKKSKVLEFFLYPGKFMKVK